MGLVTAPQQVAHASEAASPHPAAKSGQEKSRDQEVRASYQAWKTGKEVSIDALTTPTSTTVALPKGGFRVTQSLAPTRVRQGGVWKNLDATLHRNRDGSLSPNATPDAVTVSGGGTGPLARMDSNGRGLALSWPTALPRPTVRGNVATYPEVLPGVDLVVTVSAQGGLTHTLVIKTRQAAANPALAKLTIGTHTTGGVAVTADQSGNLTVAASQEGQPVFTAPAPIMWDSATAPAPQRPSAPSSTATPASTSSSRARTSAKPVGSSSDPSPKGSTPARPAGTSLGHQAFSGADGPGAFAHITRFSATTSPTSAAPRARALQADGSIELSPDVKMLTSASTVFPVYVDPTWLLSPGSRAAFASTPSSHPDDNYYNKTNDPSPQQYLQVGSDGTFTADSFVKMNISPSLAGATINKSYINFTLEHSWSCNPTPVELWQTKSLPNPISYNYESNPSNGFWMQYHGGAIQSVNAADGNATYGCPNAGWVNFNITSFMQDLEKAHPGVSNISFGLKAPSGGEWKEFDNGGNSLTMSTEYDHTPFLPANPYTSPGGPCRVGNAAQTIVGNDDVTLQAIPSQSDSNNLMTHFYVNDGSTNHDLGVIYTSSGQVAQVTIPRTTLQTTWHGDGNTTAHTYSWYTVVSDGLLDNSQIQGPGSKTSPCAFTYNPNSPPSPGIAAPSAIANTSDGAIGHMGDSPVFVFANCKTLLDSPATPCDPSRPAPTSYRYQVNNGPAVTIPVVGTQQNVNIPLTHVGPNTITVTGLSAGGNPSIAAPANFVVDRPGTAFADADFNNAGHPDLLTVGSGSGSTPNPGLWISTRNTDGTLATPTDIGSQGLVVSNGTPADWNGAQVLHGDFTGHHVQDVIAYFPATGVGTLLNGTGDTSLLTPRSGYSADLSYVFDDTNINVNANSGSGDYPTQIIAAGNASGLNTGIADIIEIAGDDTNGYELALYTTCAGCTAANYSYNKTLADKAHSPDGLGTSWNNFTLLAAQPGGKTVLFAVKNSTGEVWESAATTNADGSVNLVGTNNATVNTWTKLATPSWAGGWTATNHPTLIQADANGSSIELWATRGANATVYTLPISGGTSFTVGTTSNLLAPSHEWPLTNNNAVPGQPTIIDTEGGTTYNATPSANGITWTDATTEPVRGTTARLDGQSGYLTMPQKLLPSTKDSRFFDGFFTLSLSFKAESGQAGILYSIGDKAPDDPTGLSANSAPVMYIGTDGRLYAQFWDGIVHPLVSPARVADGQWHTATLVAEGDGHWQSLYLDSNAPVHTNPPVPRPDVIPQVSPILNIGPNSYAGAGVFNATAWIDAPGTSGTLRTSFFKGLLSDIAFYSTNLTSQQLFTRHHSSTTTTFVSGLAGNKCLDDYHSQLPPNTKIDIYTCNGTGAQTWTLNPNGTITYTANGGTGDNGSGVCLDIGGDHQSSGSPLFLWNCNGGPTQQWQLGPNGAIASAATDMCIDTPNSNNTDGTALQIYTCNGSAAQTWTSGAVNPTPITRTGTIVSNLPSHLCVDDTGASSNNGNPIQMQTCNGNPGGQSWTFQPNGTITINGKCMDITNANYANGTPIQLMQCNGNAAQQWHYDSEGIISNPSDFCLDAGNGTPLTRLTISACDIVQRQSFAAP